MIRLWFVSWAWTLLLFSVVTCGSLWIVTGCASPPCPTQLEVSGGHSRGKITSRSPGGGADDYTEHRGDVTMVFELGTHHRDCGVYNGGQIKKERSGQ